MSRRRIHMGAWARIACGLLAGLWAGAAVAQPDYPYLLPQYDFVNYAQNTLQYPGDKDANDALYSRMDDMLFKGQGQINIVHIGGSHIQADYWSDRIRQRLQMAYPGTRGGRGMVFPFRMAHTNNPYNYYPEYTGTWEACKNVQANRDCTLGLSGYSVTTRDSITRIGISFRGDETPRYDFHQVRVFHDMDSTSFEPVVLVNGQPAPSRRNEALGYTLFELGGYISTLQMEMRKQRPAQNHFTLYGISLDNSDPGFIYHAIGVNGASTSSYRRCQLFTQHLTALSPDLVVFSIGINDANTTNFDARMYETNYDTLVMRVRKANPRAAILFTTNTDSYYKKKYPNKNAEAAREVMVRLARKHRATVWDCYAVMGGLGSIKAWIAAGLAAADKVHLVKPGYELLADLLFNAMMQDYDHHLQLQSQQLH